MPPVRLCLTFSPRLFPAESKQANELQAVWFCNEPATTTIASYTESLCAQFGVHPGVTSLKVLWKGFPLPEAAVVGDLVRDGDVLHICPAEEAMLDTTSLSGVGLLSEPVTGGQASPAPTGSAANGARLGSLQATVEGSDAVGVVSLKPGSVGSKAEGEQVSSPQVGGSDGDDGDGTAAVDADTSGHPIAVTCKAKRSKRPRQQPLAAPGPLAAAPATMSLNNNSTLMGLEQLAEAAALLNPPGTALNVNGKRPLPGSSSAAGSSAALSAATAAVVAAVGAPHERPPGLAGKYAAVMKVSQAVKKNEKAAAVAAVKQRYMGTSMDAGTAVLGSVASSLPLPGTPAGQVQMLSEQPDQAMQVEQEPAAAEAVSEAEAEAEPDARDPLFEIEPPRGRSAGKGPIANLIAADARQRITIEQLREVYHLNIEEAAKELGIGMTKLKEHCRHMGIPRWPSRKLRSMDKLIESLQERAAGDSTAQEVVEDVVRELERFKQLIYDDPSIEVEDEIKRLRQSNFKKEYQQRQSAPRNHMRGPNMPGPLNGAAAAPGSFLFNRPQVPSLPVPLGMLQPNVMTLNLMQGLGGAPPGRLVAGPQQAGMQTAPGVVKPPLSMPYQLTNLAPRPPFNPIPGAPGLPMSAQMPRPVLPNTGLPYNPAAYAQGLTPAALAAAAAAAGGRPGTLGATTPSYLPANSLTLMQQAVGGQLPLPNSFMAALTGTASGVLEPLAPGAAASAAALATAAAALSATGAIDANSLPLAGAAAGGSTELADAAFAKADDDKPDASTSTITVHATAIPMPVGPGPSLTAWPAKGAGGSAAGSKGQLQSAGSGSGVAVAGGAPTAGTPRSAAAAAASTATGPGSLPRALSLLPHPSTDPTAPFSAVGSVGLGDVDEAAVTDLFLGDPTTEAAEAVAAFLASPGVAAMLPMGAGLGAA